MSTIFLRENERYLPVKEQSEPQINAILEEFLVFDTELQNKRCHEIFAHNNVSFVEPLVFLYQAKTMFFFLRSQHKTLLFALISNNKHYRNFQEDKARFPSDTKTR